MSSQSAASAFADDVLWAELNEHVRAVMGQVGIVKMMKVRDEEEGKRVWAGRVRPVLERLQTVSPVTRVAAACYSLTDGVTVQFGIHDVRVLVEGEPAVYTMLLPDPAAAVLGVIGARRWPARWGQMLAKGQPDREVILRDSPATDVVDYPWFVRTSGAKLPWTVAASEDTARIAGAAQGLGFERIATLFAEMENEKR